MRDIELLTLDEVADILRCTRSLVRGLIDRGELRGFRIGGRGLWRIEAQDLEAYINGQVNPTAAAEAESDRLPTGGASRD